MHHIYSRVVDLWHRAKEQDRRRNPCADIFREVLQREMPRGDLSDPRYIPPSTCRELCDIIARESGFLPPVDDQELSVAFAAGADRRRRGLPNRDSILNQLRFVSPIVVSLTMSSYSRKHGDFGIGLGVFAVNPGVSVGIFDQEVVSGIIQFRYEKLITFVGTEEGDVMMTRIHRGLLFSTFSLVDPLSEIEMEIKGRNKAADILHDALSGKFTV